MKKYSISFEDKALPQIIEVILNYKFVEVPVKNQYERLRFKRKDFSVIIYFSNNIVLDFSDTEENENLATKIEEIVDYLGIYSVKDRLLIGMDETGKGEIFGNIFLCCAVVRPENVFTLKNLVLNVNTKKNVNNLEKVFNTLSKIVDYRILPISPQEMRDKNLNKLMSEKYLELLDKLIYELSLETARKRITIDDFGIKNETKEYIKEKFKDDEVIIQPKADDRYIECKIASIISKFHQRKELEKLRKQYSLGSGNMSDVETINWLKDIDHKDYDFIKPWKIKKEDRKGG